MIEWQDDKEKPHIFTRVESNEDEQFCGLRNFKGDLISKLTYVRTGRIHESSGN